jgi:hypothetical protein
VEKRWFVVGEAVMFMQLVIPELLLIMQISIYTCHKPSMGKQVYIIEPVQFRQSRGLNE